LLNRAGRIDLTAVKNIQLGIDIPLLAAWTTWRSSNPAGEVLGDAPGITENPLVLRTISGG
jgi:hypothetical protein